MISLCFKALAAKYPGQESNLYLEFRKPSFYPLNYGDKCLIYKGITAQQSESVCKLYD